jgi:hypothetical protein
MAGSSAECLPTHGERSQFVAKIGAGWASFGSPTLFTELCNTTAALYYPSNVRCCWPMSMALTLQSVRFTAAMAVFACGSIHPFCAGEALSPAELVRQSVYNEVNSDTNSARRFMFKDQRKTAHLSQTKLIVETKDATAGMLIQENGHPLSEQQRRQEEARLANYINNPEELNKKRKQEKEDAEHTERILKALPDAFLYEADGTEQGSPAIGHAGDQLVRLKFRPNPSYDPPSRVEQVLTGMEGHLLIDAREKRVAEIDGVLQKEVGFGWGILGHLDRGGRFLVQQADVGGGQWELTHMELAFNGKILLLKKLSIQSSDIFSDFRPVPADLSFAQGVELLKKHATEMDANTQGRPHKTLRNVDAKRTEAQADAKREQQLCCER